MEENQNQKKKQLNEYVKYSGMGMQMIITFCLAAWGGIKADEYFQMKTPLFTIFFLLFAVVSSIYFVIKTLTK